jgi:hypothetical protein
MRFRLRVGGKKNGVLEQWSDGVMKVNKIKDTTNYFPILQNSSTPVHNSNNHYFGGYKMKTLIIVILSLMAISSVSAQMTTDIVNMGSTTQSFITLQAAGINSIGEFKDAWDGGTGITLGYCSITSDNFAVLLKTGYINFDANADMGYTGDAKFSIVPLAIGGRYYFVTERIRPFLLAMSGINIVSQNYTLEDETVDKTSAHLHFQVGIGLGILLFGQLEIEGQAKYNSHVLEPSLPYNITGMEYGLALNWHL